LANLRKPLYRRAHIAAANAFLYNTPSNPYNFKALKSFLEEHLPSNRYDLVIVTTPPSQYLKLGHWINRRFNIPFWADFRDYLFLFDTAANTIQQTGGAKKTILQHYLRQTRRYLSRASIVSAVSQPIITDLELRHKFDEHIILNGFEAADAPKESADMARTTKFTISILGTIYPKQDIGFMLEGFREFVKGREDKVAINFIGTGSDENVRKKIEGAIWIPGLRVTDWMPRPEAMATIAGSNVLYYIGWNNLKGIYSGKIFEYLGAGRNILVGPNDHDVVEALLNDTRSGKLADSPAEMTAILNAWFAEWQQNGYLAHNADAARILAYSREAQAARVADILRGHFSNSK
jgi:hypothetical protein